MRFFDSERQNFDLPQVRILACRGVAQPGSASGLGPEGREFESHRPDHSYTKQNHKPLLIGWFFFAF